MKIILRIIIAFVIITSLPIFGGYTYIKNSWKEFTIKERIIELTHEIKNSKKLPDLFYQLYELDNLNTLRYDHKRILIQSIINNQYETTPSNIVSKMVGFSITDFKKIQNHGLNLKYYEFSLTWEIEDNTNQYQCLNWVVENFDFLNSNIGIERASIFYFGKPLSDLNKLETAKLVVMMKNPAIYNPNRRGKLVNEKALILVNKFDKYCTFAKHVQKQ